MHYKFHDAKIEKMYNDARRMLADEDERQAKEASRLREEWRLLPEEIRAENEHWLRQHFHACREPYVKLVTNIVALAIPVIQIEVHQRY